MYYDIKDDLDYKLIESVKQNLTIEPDDINIYYDFVHDDFGITFFTGVIIHYKGFRTKSCIPCKKLDVFNVSDVGKEMAQQMETSLKYALYKKEHRGDRS